MGVPSRIVLAAVLLHGAIALADENEDLRFIPGAIPQGAPAPAAQPSACPLARGDGRVFIEDAATLWSRRGELAVPLPPPPPADWRNRTSLDARWGWKLADGLRATVSDRANVVAQSDIDVPAHRQTRNDFREGYLTWEPVARTFLEAGRVNLKNGVALGYNPTDFFKTGTRVDQASQDPSDLREDRLGTLMLRQQTIGSQGSFSLAFAPRLAAPAAIDTAAAPAIHPLFDRTNNTDRWLVTASHDLVGDVSPELLFYRQANQTRWGANLSHGIGNSIVVYGEWAGGRQPRLGDAALAYGRRTGILPDVPLPLPAAGNGAAFRNDAAVGGSWTSAARVTINLEYHGHQAGLARQDWRQWFAEGASPSPLAGPLWYLRGYAAFDEDPVSRRQVFLRIDWPEGLLPHFDLSGFVFINPDDGSALTQAAVRYDLSGAWTIGALAAAALGGRRSEYGSAPQAGSAILQAIRYF